MPQNPFRIRASEQATDDDQFLSLVGPHVLDMLPEDQLWDRLVILESAPGAGKTTILRLFTPESLGRLQRLSDQEAYRPLFERLKDLGVLTRQGPTVAGVLVNCREQYATIQDLPIEQPNQIRWFFGLLDARITLLTLRSILRLHGLAYPDEVGRLEVRPNDRAMTISETISGLELYERSREAERTLTQSLNNLMGVRNVANCLLNSLRTPKMLSASDLFLNGSPLQERLLLMFDDVHELADLQQQELRRDLEQRDLALARWIALRSQALDPGELVTFARTEGRDFKQVKIEEWARGHRRQGRKFFDLLHEIGNRRAQRALVDIDAFDSCLMANSTDKEILIAQKARDATRDRVIDFAKGQQRFSEWIANETDAIREISSASEAAVRWRKLLIVMEFRMGRGQIPLDFPLPMDQLESRSSSGIAVAAELFLSREYGLPFYYGTRRIMQLSSWNIEQFLRIAGDLFEQVLATIALSRKKSSQLSALQQDSLLRNISRERLRALPKEVPYGIEVRRLVDAIGVFCQAQTNRPSAPYAPGMTGVGISNLEAELLGKASDNAHNSPLNRLSRIIASAIANNVLEVKPDVNVKGGRWTVYYLNRLYCPAFGLPLGYSGYRENVGVRTLLSWSTSGYQDQQAMEFDL